MSLFLCPICRRSLMREETRYRCENGHSYDIASAGYVHLLPANQKHSLVPGDDKQMAAARNRFLNGAWYQPLREAIARIALEVMPSQGTFLTRAVERDIIPPGSGRRWKVPTKPWRYMESIFPNIRCAGRPNGTNPSSLPWRRLIICPFPIIAWMFCSIAFRP